MRFPISDAAIREMSRIKRQKLRNARAVARKADLRAGTGELPPRTVIDGYFGLNEMPYGRQYTTDLTNVERIRITSRSSSPVYLFRSSDMTETLRPAYSPFLDVDNNPISASVSGTVLDWRLVDPEDVGPCRLTLSSAPTAVAWVSSLFDGPFSVSVQVS